MATSWKMLPQRKLLLVVGLKISLAVLLLWWLTRTGSIMPSVLFGAISSVPEFGISASCMLLALGLGVYRWQLVMALLGVEIGYARALRIYWIGAFASTFLPGAATGDLLRAVFVARAAAQARTRAAISVFVDRFFGLLGFVLSGLVLLGIRFDAVLKSVVMRDLAMRLLVVLVLGLLSLLVMAWIGKQIAQSGVTDGFERKFHSLRRAAIKQARRLSYPDMLVLLSVVCMSLAIPFLLTCALLPFVPGLVLSPATLIDLGIASNAAQIANTIPLTPGGIGIGEGVFESVLALLWQPSPVVGYASAFLSLRVVTVAVNAVGGVLFFLPGSLFGDHVPVTRALEGERCS